MSEKTIALLGQPNSGKSTLFNGLTGSRQHVGNWPGKTVDGSFVHKDTTYKIIDLPGTYSLSANSDEEVVTRNYIASGQADVVCILADASQLNRSLFMLADYTGIRVPVVLLLNMMDVAKSQGKQIDTNGIAKSLGIPVVPLVAADKKQYGTFFRMLESIDKNASTLDEKRLAQIYQNTIGAAFDEIKALLPADGIGIYSSTWLTAKLIEQDKLARSLVKETVDAGTYTAIEKKLSDVKDGNLLTGDCKFQWIDKLVNENVTSKKNKLLRSRFDKAATSKRWGKPIAIGMIVLGLICSMVIGFPLMGLFSGLISAISVPLANWLLDIGAAPFLVSLLCNAILTAVSFALQMASYVFGISLVFGLMEDVGYMARISYVFDDTMTKLGLQGKAIMPFLVSFGCNIGGITGTRVIDSWGQRVMTIALSWVVPCASTWGVVGLVSGTFFGNGAVVVVLALFAVAFLLVLLSLILQTHSSKSTISELSAASTSALDNAVKLQEQNRALQEEKQQLEDELDAVQKKLDEETALNDQLLQATQDEQSDAKQELRDKEQELDHTRLAYEALLTAMNCDTHEGNVTFSRAMETVARYQECLSENALAEFEKLQEQ